MVLIGMSHLFMINTFYNVDDWRQTGSPSEVPFTAFDSDGRLVVVKVNVILRFVTKLHD